MQVVSGGHKSWVGTLLLHQSERFEWKSHKIWILLKRILGTILLNPLKFDKLQAKDREKCFLNKFICNFQESEIVYKWWERFVLMKKWIRKPWNCFSIIHGHGIHTNQNQEKMAEEKHHNERQNEFTQYTTKPSKCYWESDLLLFHETHELMAWIVRH